MSVFKILFMWGQIALLLMNHGIKSSDNELDPNNANYVLISSDEEAEPEDPVQVLFLQQIRTWQEQDDLSRFGDGYLPGDINGPTNIPVPRKIQDMPMEETTDFFRTAEIKFSERWGRRRFFIRQKKKVHCRSCAYKKDLIASKKLIERYGINEILPWLELRNYPINSNKQKWIQLCRVMWNYKRLDDFLRVCTPTSHLMDGWQSVYKVEFNHIHYRKLGADFLRCECTNPQATVNSVIQVPFIFFVTQYDSKSYFKLAAGFVHDESNYLTIIDFYRNVQFNRISELKLFTYSN